MARLAGRAAFVAIAALGLVAGAGSAVAWMARGLVPVGGGWMGSRVAGSGEADPWTRAGVALTGLMALDRSQALYFVRRSDDAGRPLVETCRYRLSGGPMPGHWWSVTVYAADNYLPQNDDHALSVDATRVRPDSAGRWQAIASSRAEPGQVWVSTRAAGHFDLTLRIYAPTAAAQADLASIALPQVERIDCGRGAGA
jgi:hypothetical protein